MQRSELLAEISKRDYDVVRKYLLGLKTPFFDLRDGIAVNETPVLDITERLSGIPCETSNRYYLKEEYCNHFTGSIKGRPIISMVLAGLNDGSIYRPDGSKKYWFEPTSGNTGKGLAELARILGVEFTAVLSRLDVPQRIKKSIEAAGGHILTIGSEYTLEDLGAIARNLHRKVRFYWSMLSPINAQAASLLLEKLGASLDVGDSIRKIEGGFLIDPLLPLALEASKSPISERTRTGEFERLKSTLKVLIPELDNPNYVVAFLCNHGNSSMAVNTLLSQLGFSNVGSLKGGMDSLQQRRERGEKFETEEFCPVPGASVARSSIEFVKAVVSSKPDEYFSFMQYENVENLTAHEMTTGPELARQIPELDAVVCTFGTGGTATGLARYFREKSVKIIVAFPESPVEGIRTLRGADGLAFYRPDIYSMMVEVPKPQSDSILSYLHQRNLPVGPSTAVAVAAALNPRVGELVRGGKIAIIAADGIENYERSGPFENEKA